MNKSGVAANVITLPQGGGALRGIGETFSAHPQTGVGSATIPLALPGGRRGIGPTLRLAYSSGSGAGAFGLGWEIDVPGVARKTTRGVPRYDGTDVLVLSGAEDLVPVGVAGGETLYRPRTEVAFARIAYRPERWHVTALDGTTSLYDVPLADPDVPVRVFAWKIGETRDLVGNRVTYEWDRDLGDTSEHRWAQCYLRRIQWVGTLDGAGGETFLYSVRLEYETRPDAFSDYRAGFEIRTRRRCASIDVLLHDGPEMLIRRYRMQYEVDPHTGVSLLVGMQVLGADETPALPPLRLRYTRFEPENRRFFPLGGGSLPARSLASRAIDLASLHGNGLPDFVELDGVARSWRNLGDGRFDVPRAMGAAPVGLHLDDPGVQLLDADGDGRIDLVVTAGPLAGSVPIGATGEWDSTGFRPYAVAPPLPLDDPDLRLIDLDGDGVTDALRAASVFECYFSHPDRGWDRVVPVPRGPVERFPDVSFQDQRVKLGDFNGDGLQDIALVQDGLVQYWPSLGHGRWGRRVTMAGAIDFPAGRDPRRVLVGDVDGDGLADLVYVDADSVTIWFNRAGNGWSTPLVVHGTPPVTDLDAVRIVDLLGTGVSGLLYSADDALDGRPSHHFLDLTGRTRARLLSVIDNGLGAVTEVEYRSSTDFFLADDADPATRWATPLPFPVAVVAQLTVRDAISGGKMVTEYRYHQGAWDGVEREFRGFGLVEQTDSQTFAAYHAPGDCRPVARTDFAAPTLTRTWFHLGPVRRGEADGPPPVAGFWTGDAPLLGRLDMSGLPAGGPPRTTRDAARAVRGRPIRSEVYALDGSAREDRPFTVTEYECGIRLEQLGTYGTPVLTPFPVAERTTAWEGGTDPLTRVTFFDRLDPFGRPLARTDVSLPRRQSRRTAVVAAAGTVPGDAVNEVRILALHSRTAHATPDAGLYLHDRIADVRDFTLEPAPGVIETAPGDVARVLADGMAAARAVRQTFATLDAWTPGTPLPVGLRLIGHTRTHYDGTPFIGRPAGEVGPHGLPAREETLVLTEAGLTAVYGAAHPVLTGHRTEQDSITGYHAGRYVDTVRREHSSRGLLIAEEDGLGNRTRVTYDRFDLLPEIVVDAGGLDTRAAYDYRFQQPVRVTDANGDGGEFRFTAAGLLHATGARGRNGEGGDDARPDTRYRYDLFAYDRTRGTPAPQPAFVHTVRRVWHASANVSDETIEQRDYSDGFGRMVQSQAHGPLLAIADLALPADMGPCGPAVAMHDPDRVIVTGWQVLDNKGRPVAQYEPFFASGFGFHPERDASQGQRIRLEYDTLGREVRVIRPDGGERRQVFGVPASLAAPAPFEPTPWEQFAYDANDLAGQFCPSSVVVDALGRVVAGLERDADGPPGWRLTRSTYDLRGNLVEIIDPLGRPAIRHAYDLVGRRLRTLSIDGGERRAVLDAVGNVIESRDAAGMVVHREYDALNRPVRVRVTENGIATLRERTTYGESSAMTRQAAAAAGLLGRPATIEDEAGRLEFTAYDLRGAPLGQARQLLGDAVQIADWDAAPGLDVTVYRSAVRYDALGRPVEVTAPVDPTGACAVLTSRYGRSGQLESAALDGTAIIRAALYNARGQRVLAEHGNGVVCRWAYDPLSARLVRQRTERGARQGDTWTGQGGALDDRGYGYDPNGNVLTIDERIAGCGVAGAPEGRDRLTRRFAYDAWDQLVSATGRTAAGTGSPRPLADTPRGRAATPANAPDQTEVYTETYRYDAAGNLTRQHHAAASGAWVRTFGHAAGSNRLTALSDGATFGHDANGNVRTQNADRTLDWDHAGRLRTFTIQAGPAPSLQARYRYDGQGRRVQKRVQTGTVDSTVYIGALFEHHRWPGGEQALIHVTDSDRRIAVVRRGAPHPDDAGPAVQYHFADHLGHSTTVVGGDIPLDSGFIRREEYFPYGETSFGSYGRKRYRFAGKERDAETGLDYAGARYLAPWLGRWISPDPAGEVDGPNLYVYARDNPVRFVDAAGTQSADAVEEEVRTARGTPDIQNALYAAEPLGEAAGEIAETFAPGGSLYTAAKETKQQGHPGLLTTLAILLPGIGALRKLKRWMHLVNPIKTRWGAKELAHPDIKKWVGWATRATTTRSELVGEGFAQLAAIGLGKRYDVAYDLEMALTETRLDWVSVYRTKAGFLGKGPTIIAEFKNVADLSTLGSGNTRIQLERQLEASTATEVLYEIIVGPHTTIGKTLIDQLKHHEAMTGFVWRISRFDPQKGTFKIEDQAARLK